MSNYKIQLNLTRLPGAFVSNLKGKTAAKRCLCIPIEDANLFVGERGVYLNLNAWEMRERNAFGNTHYIKPRLSRQAHEAMTDEQRKAIPIVGDMTPREEFATETVANDGSQFAPSANAAQPAPEPDDDLPF